MTITIRKGAKGAEEWCDRRSPLGNPFHLSNEDQRNAVCDAYQEYFDLVVQLQPVAAALDSTPDYPIALAVIKVSQDYRLSIAPAWRRPNYAAFTAELNRLSAILKAEGAIALKCWCINVAIQSAAGLQQPKRCHCLSIAGYLLTITEVFSEQLQLEV